MCVQTRACGSVLSKTFEERGVGKTYIVCSHGNPGRITQIHTETQF